LIHCWLKLKDFPKWKDSFKLWYKVRKRTTEDNEDEDVPGKGGAYKDRPRGHKASKTNLRRKASFLALENTLKSVFADKEEASAKRDERRRQDKEEQILSFTDIQRKTLEVQQRKLDLAEIKEKTRAKGLELKAKECEATLLAEESKTMMADLSALDPTRRAWFENKQMIRARDT
jgi:hypothetical protein